MTQGSYKQFCPVAMASEVLCTRWTILVLREMLMGSTRFNDLRRGLSRMSPALLSQRLKDLEEAGVVRRVATPNDPSVHEYHLTQAGKELLPLIEGLGSWGHRWVESEVSLQHLDAQLLMWDMRRRLDTRPLPKKRSNIEFLFPDAPANQRKWWLVVEPDGCVDLCGVDPGFDVNLYVSTDLRTMTAIWMGLDKLSAAVKSERVLLTGDAKLKDDMNSWLGYSTFATVDRIAS